MPRKVTLLLVEPSISKGRAVLSDEETLKSWGYGVVRCIVPSTGRCGIKQDYNERIRDGIESLCHCTGLTWTDNADSLMLDALTNIAQKLQMPMAPLMSWRPREA